MDVLHMPKASKTLLRGEPGAAERLLKGKASHVQQLNDELAEDVIASSKNNPIVRLGIETVGIE